MPTPGQKPAPKGEDANSGVMHGVTRWQILRQPLSSFFNGNGCRDISTLPSIFILWKNAQQRQNNGIQHHNVTVISINHWWFIAWHNQKKLKPLEKVEGVNYLRQDSWWNFVLGLALVVRYVRRKSIYLLWRLWHRYGFERSTINGKSAWYGSENTWCWWSQNGW